MPRNLELLEGRVKIGGELNYQDPEYGSALMFAINNNNNYNVGIIQFLIDSGVNLSAQNEHGIVPLEVVLHHSSESVLRLLS